jgi:hypothetical protein
MSKQRTKSASTVPPENISVPERLIDRILGLPRLARIVIVAVFGLAATAVLFPIVDRVYLTNFFSEQTVIIPSLISAGFGIIMYVAGWVLMVGTRASPLPKRLAIVFYIVFGIIIVLYVLILIVNGYSTATAPDV